VVNNGALAIDRSDDLTFAGNISGTGTVVKNGSNTVTLTGTNTHGGGTTVNGGTLIVGGDANLGTNSATVTLDGGNLRTTGNATNARAMNIGVAGGTLIVDTGATFATTALNGTATTMTKSGAGTWTVGAGIIGTTLNVNEGQLEMGGSATLEANTAVTINSGGTFRFTRNDMFGNHAAPIPSQTFTVNGGTLTNTGVFNALNQVTLNGGTITANGGAAPAFPSFAFKGTVSVTGTAPSVINATGLANSQILVGDTTAGTQTNFNVADVTNSSATDLTVSAALRNNQSPGFVEVATGVLKTGPGKMLLSGGNIYTGQTTVNEGLLELTGGFANNAITTITINNSGRFSFARNDTWGNHAANVFTSIVVNAGGVLSNSGNFFTTLGPVTLNGGTIQSVGGAAAAYPSFAFTKPVTVGGTSVSTITGSGTNSQMAIGTTTLGSQTSFTVADATGSAASDLVVSVVLQNYRNVGGAEIATGLIKDGPGTMELSVTNSFTGTSTVNAGTLAVTGSISGSAVIVNGGLLAGTGTVGATIIGGAGDLAPGFTLPVGTLNFASTLSLGGDAIFDIQKTGVSLSSDRANVTGALTLGGVLTVSSLGDTLAQGDSFDLFNAASFAGSFATVNLPSLQGGLDWDTSQLSTTGVIAVVPEPASTVCLLGGLMVLVGRRRRK
jgi:autotransporter-associated beta strand protein